MSPRATAPRGGFNWRLRWPELGSSLGEVLDAFPRLDVRSGAEILKSNRYRTVFRLSSGWWRPPPEPGDARPYGDPARPSTPGLIVKVYRYRSVWDRVRYVGIRHRAAQEYRTLGRLGELGFPVPQSFAVAERRFGPFPVEGGLVLALLEGCTPLGAHLSQGAHSGLGCTDRQRILEDLGRLVRRLHDHGVWHRDLHAGNLLVHADSGRIHLVDVHSCVFLPRLTGGIRVAGIAKLVHSLGGVGSPDAIAALLGGYGVEAIERRGRLPPVRARIVERAARLERIRLRSRSKRCFVDSTQFAVERSGSTTTYRRRSLPAADLDRLISEVAAGPRECGERSAEISLGGQRLVVLRRAPGPLAACAGWFCSHELRRAYAGAHALDVRGLPSRRALALREERRFGLLREAWLVAEESPWESLEQVAMDRFWRKGTVSPDLARWKHALAGAAGRLLRRIHDAGIDLGGLGPGDVGVVLGEADRGREPDLLLLRTDLQVRASPLPLRLRLRDLAGLGLFPEGHVTEADLLRGLEAYAADGPFWQGGTPAMRVLLRRLQRRLLGAHLRGILCLEDHGKLPDPPSLGE